jgi:hypothetical protein
MTAARAELRARISAHLIADGAVSTEIAVGLSYSLMDLFQYVEDEWNDLDITTLGEQRGSAVLQQRFLVARVVAETVERRPNRTVGTAS